jgi:hypothetical protein
MKIATCEEQGVLTKQAGSSVVTEQNFMGGVTEIRWATITRMSCSVRDGNVLAQ